MNEPRRASPEMLRQLISTRGWTITLLARAINISREHLSRVINDRSRSLQWEFCLHGIPKLNPTWKESLMRSAPVTTSSPPCSSSPFLYDLGTVFRALEDFDSEIIPPYGTGVCLDRRLLDGGEDQYLVRFDGGGEDWFGRKEVESMLVETGEIRAEGQS